MSDTRTREELAGLTRQYISGAQNAWTNQDEALAALDILTARLEAYEAEHEAAANLLRSFEMRGRSGLYYSLQEAHNHAERVRRGE